MKCTQNEKIMQIKNETMVVGIDIGKETHYARAFDNRGIELAKLLRFNNTKAGYEALNEWMQMHMQKQGKTEAIIGFEPTGHYWFTLGDYLRGQGYELGIVNPFHVKCTRELDDNSQTKNDRKDPKTIAMLVKDGRYRQVYIPTNLYQELREAVAERERLQEQLAGISNRVIRWLDIRFPEFTVVFKNWSLKTAMVTLKYLPTPEKVQAAGAEGVLKLWKSHLKRSSLKKAERLAHVASESIGRIAGRDSAEMTLQNLLKQYELMANQRQEVEDRMAQLLLQVPYAGKVLEIKGVGMVTAATLISEIGDIRRFDSPRQILKMAGLNLKENSSGKHKGKTTISKRGRRRLREALFQVMIAMLASNEEFKARHRYNLTREKNPLSKMQSVIALCGKFVRILYALLTKGCSYDATKMIDDLKNMSMRAAA